MSIELIAIIVSSAALALSFFGVFIGGFAWMIRRTDAQFQRAADRTDAQFATLRNETKHDIGTLRGEVSTLRDDMKHDIGTLRGELITLLREQSERISGVERELVEVKIAVARIEGPPRHLLSAR